MEMLQGNQCTAIFNKNVIFLKNGKQEGRTGGEYGANIVYTCM
jgi:hypothetical protein